MSAERIDHAAEALSILPATENAGGYPAEGRIAFALVHATLALVEQQKIANQIALRVYNASVRPSEGLTRQEFGL